MAVVQFPHAGLSQGLCRRHFARNGDRLRPITQEGRGSQRAGYRNSNPKPREFQTHATDVHRRRESRSPLPFFKLCEHNGGHKHNHGDKPKQDKKPTPHSFTYHARSPRSPASHDPS